MKIPVQVAALAFVAFTSPSLQAQGQSVEQGIQLFDARNYAAAKTVLLPHAENDASAAYYLGRIEMGNDDPGKAAEWFERAVGMNPKSALYHNWLGRAYGMQARSASMFRAASLARKSRNALETALALDPDNLDVRDDLIVYYSRAPGIVGGSKEKARAMLLEIKKRNAYRGSLAAANLCNGEKDFACAERELTGMLASYPDSAAVYSLFAAFYSEQKQFDKAFELLDRRLRAKPNELTTLYAIGRTASLSGQNLDRGEQSLRTYLASPTPERGPAPAHVHYRLGTIHEKKGEKDRAREEYRAALLLNPRHEDAKKALAALK
jgi:tetratricopeptide (TPR) repeat protein